MWGSQWWTARHLKIWFGFTIPHLIGHRNLTCPTGDDDDGDDDEGDDDEGDNSEGDDDEDDDDDDDGDDDDDKVDGDDLVWKVFTRPNGWSYEQLPWKRQAAGDRLGNSEVNLKKCGPQVLNEFVSECVIVCMWVCLCICVLVYMCFYISPLFL